MNRLNVLFLALHILSGSLAFAGPEDHLYETCYDSHDSVPRSLISSICFETAQLGPNAISFGGALKNVGDSYPIVYRELLSNGKTKVVASGTLLDRHPGGCMESEMATVYFQTEITPDAQSLPADSFQVWVEYAFQADNCHSAPQKSRINYRLDRTRANLETLFGKDHPMPIELQDRVVKAIQEAYPCVGIYDLYGLTTQIRKARIDQNMFDTFYILNFQVSYRPDGTHPSQSFIRVTAIDSDMGSDPFNIDRIESDIGAGSCQ